MITFNWEYLYSLLTTFLPKSMRRRYEAKRRALVIYGIDLTIASGLRLTGCSASYETYDRGR